MVDFRSVSCICIKNRIVVWYSPIFEMRKRKTDSISVNENELHQFEGDSFDEGDNMETVGLLSSEELNEEL